MHVLGSVANGQSPSHRVCVSNGFNLKIKQQGGLVFSRRVGVIRDQGPSLLSPALRSCTLKSPIPCPHSLQVPAFLQVYSRLGSSTKPSFPELSAPPSLLPSLKPDSGDAILPTQVQIQLGTCTDGAKLEGSYGAIKWNPSYPSRNVLPPPKGSCIHLHVYIIQNIYIYMHV